MDNRHATIRLSAEYRPGYTDELLGWTVESFNGRGTLNASWIDWKKNRNRQQLECNLNLSHVPVDTAWDWLAPLDAYYGILATDLNSCEITLIDNANQLQRGIYGYGSELLEQNPELLAFYMIWDAIDSTVEEYLPSELRCTPPPWR